MKQDEKFYLSTGKCVEDELFVFGMQYQHDHPFQSFIIDIKDYNYVEYDVFTKEELQEIKTYEEKKLLIMPIRLRNYIASFNKNNAAELRKEVFKSQEFDQGYDHGASHDYDWVRFTVYSLLREYESGNPKKAHNEEWYMSRVWSFIDTIFNGVKEITVLRGETASTSLSK